MIKEFECVNPLHVGELISTEMEESMERTKNCVNPLHVGELISTIKLNNILENSKSVNPLHVGELISTYLVRGNMTYGNHVSIPFTSGNSFLQVLDQQVRENCDELCQSPSRRGTHFYLQIQ